MPSTLRRICFDRIIPPEISTTAGVEQLIRHSGLPSMGGSDRIGPYLAFQSALDPNQVSTPLALAMVAMKKWPNGKMLSCGFLEGSDTQQQRVMEKARIWEGYANVHFDFTSAQDAEIRIAFTADPGSWSAVGTDALNDRYFPAHQPTMNFGWLDDNTPDEEYERVVVHEFGHALGAVHEHQSPSANLDWNVDAVYASFKGPPNYWTPEQIDQNILQKYSPEGMLYTRFDPESIMLYMFPSNLFLSGKPTNENAHLSDRDKQFIAQMYPRTGAQVVRPSPPAVHAKHHNGGAAKAHANGALSGDDAKLLGALRRALDHLQVG